MNVLYPELQWHMRSALEQAEKAYRIDEVPVGALVINEYGEVLSKAHNEKEKQHNPVGHAEILAMQRAAENLGSWRLTNCSVIVTLEPCTMCLSAMVQARVKQCIFGAYDAKGGALSLNYDLYKDTRLNHRFSVTGGVLHWESSNILSRYFREKRQAYKMKRS